MPYIFIGAANFVVVLALPAKLPVTLPTTLPVKLPVTSPVKLPVTLPVTLPVKLPVTLPTTLPTTLPVNEEVIFPALKLPLASLLTNVLNVLLEVAAFIVELMVVMVEEFTPPTLFTVGKSAVPPKSFANIMIPLAVVVAGVAELDI